VRSATTVARALDAADPAAARAAAAAAPGLVRCLAHGRADIRKGAVFALVALMLALGGEAMGPQLEALTDSQRRLVDIYYERARGGQP
jgi:hypothetical protein